MSEVVMELETIKAKDAPSEFLTNIFGNPVTLWRNRLADYDGNIYFSFPYISWCDAFYIPEDEDVEIFFEEVSNDDG